jgi:methylmalonyl-CoA mutase N-terminal domain/subunit
MKAQRTQLERIRRVKAQRDNHKVKALLEKLQKAYQNPETNSMYPLLDAVSAYATLGEIVSAGRVVFGTFKEPQII